MLLQSPRPVEKRCPQSWSLLVAAGLLSLSVVVAGVELRAVAAPAPAPAEPKKEQPKKEEPKKEEPKKENPAERDPFDLLPDLEKLFENIPGGAPEEMKKLREEMKKSREEMKKALEMMRKLQGGALPGFPGGLPGGLPGGFQGVFPVLPGINVNRGLTPEGRLGARFEKPNDTLVEQLDLPRGQGLILENVKANSAAAKAGLKDHDVLLEFNGKAVPNNVEDFSKQMSEIKANTPVDVVVLRKGKKETVKGLSLPEAKQVVPGRLPGINVFPNVFPGGVQGKNVTQETTRDGNNFTTRRQEGDVTITITGTFVEGKATPAKIEISDGKGDKKYESVDKVPDEHQAAVKRLLESLSRNKIKIEIPQ